MPHLSVMRSMTEAPAGLVSGKESLIVHGAVLAD